MKNNELLIALCGYLPYGVKAYHSNQPDALTITLDHKTYTTKDVGLSVVLDSEDWKPMLMPISYLTQQITINGETFCPMKELAANCIDGFNAVAKSIENVPISLWPHWVIEKLNSWFIDYRGLISNGLAIDVTTLDKNPYA